MDATESGSVVSPTSFGESMYRWFEAGDARLVVAVNTPVDPAVEALHDASLLGTLDPVLSEIEHHCDCEYDWTPIAPESGEVALSVTRPDMPALGLRLADAQQQRLLAATSDTGLSVQKLDVSLYLELDQFLLGDSDAARLVPGGLVLMPASFAPVWHARLVDVSDAVGAAVVEVDFDRDAERIRCTGIPSKEPPVRPTGAPDDNDEPREELSPIRCRIYSEAPIELRLDSVSVGDIVETPIAQLQAVRVVVERRHERQAFFAGRLVDLGRGLAVLLDPH